MHRGNDVHRTISLASAALVASVAAAAAADPGPKNLVLSCTGAFAADADRDRLAAVFGAGNVVDVEIDVGEGMTEPGTVIYPDDPARRVDIFWHDGEARRRPLSVLVRSEGSLWQGPAGIRLGSTLAEVEALNGGPFELLGFDWDQGGYVTAWNGKLGATTGEPSCPFTARFGPTATGGYDVVGDTVFPSSIEAMAIAKPVVVSIGIGWAAP